MNKKYLLSTAAASAIAMIITGCGNSSTSSSSTSGNAQKSALDGATVTIGGATTTTNALGEWTVSGATGSTVTVTGGTMTMPDGSTVTNTVTLESTISDDNPNNTVSLATTLVKQFSELDDVNSSQAKTRVQNLLGLTETELFEEPDALTGTSVTDVNEMKNRQVLIWNMLIAAKDSTEGTAALLKDLNATGSAAVSTANFAAAVTSATTAAYDAAVTAGDSTSTLSDANTTLASLSSAANLVKQEQAILQAADNNTTTVTETAFSGVFDIQGDPDVTTSSATGFYVTDGDINQTGNGLLYASQSTLTTSAALFHDANSTLFRTGVLDRNATITAAADTGELLIEFTDNNTSSYTARLNALTVNVDESDYLTFAYNSNTTLEITANSNTSVAVGVTGDASTFTAAVFGNNDGNLTVNLSSFVNYVLPLAEAHSSTANGNFSVDMNATGSFGAKVLFNTDLNTTYGSGLYNAPRSSITVEGTSHTGYKLLDANLTK